MYDQKTNLFERIKTDFKSLIDKGAYLEGEPLPSVRQTALKLGVNPNTVQKAYQLLESDGYIEIIPKKGAYVKRKIKTDVTENALKNALKNHLKTHNSKETLKLIETWIGEMTHD